MIAVLGFSALAQKEEKLDLSIAGVKLGNRASATAFLEGYSSRVGEDGRPVFLFYNLTGPRF